MILEYFQKIKESLKGRAHIIADQATTEKVYSEKKGFIEGEVIFSDDTRLDFAEVKDIEMDEKIKYRYHYMDERNEMIFRYDNAKHFPELPTFPHHKHTPEGVVASNEKDMNDILSEIEPLVVSKKTK